MGTIPYSSLPDGRWTEAARASGEGVQGIGRANREAPVLSEGDAHQSASADHQFAGLSRPQRIDPAGACQGLDGMQHTMTVEGQPLRPAERPQSAIAQQIIGTVMRETYLYFALHAGLMATGLFTASLILAIMR